MLFDGACCKHAMSTSARSSRLVAGSSVYPPLHVCVLPGFLLLCIADRGTERQNQAVPWRNWGEGVSRESLRVSQKTGGGGEHAITQSPYSSSNALWKYLVVLLVSVWDTEVSTFTLEGGGGAGRNRFQAVGFYPKL